MADLGRKFDDVLRNLAGQAGSLEALLGVFFSFLHRNTDFYVTFDPAKTSRAGMGFPSGKAEQLLLRAFRSFPYKQYDRDVVASSKQYQQRQHQQQRRTGDGQTPATAAVAVTSSATTTGSVQLSSSSTPRGDIRNSTVSASHDSLGKVSPSTTSHETTPSAAAVASASASPTSASPPSSKAQAGNDHIGPPSSTTPPPAGPPTRPPSPKPAAAREVSVRYTKDGKQVPIGNGGVTSRYYWTQTVKEATVYVDVPPGTRSKDVSCVIQPRWLKLKVKGAGKVAGETAEAPGPAPAPAAPVAEGEGVPACPKGDPKNNDKEVIFDGELPSAVSREDSMWSLNDGTTVVISFEKTTKSWWKSVVVGDPEIDTSQVDSTTKISEYDGETQGAIRKIMFDQRQKSLGLPTSDQLSADALLEKAKSLPGSPFLPGGVLHEGDGHASVNSR